MANKKAKYHVKNRSGYDTLLFETILSQVTDSPIKSLERSTAYKANAICSESTLAKGGFLVCTTAGTTAGTVPTVYASATENATITDGTAKFVVHYFENLATLMSKTAGSATQPIYFNKGVPTATSYSVAKSVPSDAKFTDTTYSDATQSAHGLMTAADKKKLDGVATGANAYIHPTSGVTAGTYRSVTVNAQGHVTGGSNPTITVAQGGTGLTSSPSILTNLGSTSAANVLQASPRPGVTGTLPVASGGTGASNASGARTNLGLETAIIGASISGTNITLTKADGTTQTLTTKDSPSNEKAYIVETWRSEWNWYIKYSNGWVEQGGKATENTGKVSCHVTLHVPMSDTKYTIVHGTGGSNDTWDCNIANVTTTGFTIYNNYGTGAWWRACGYKGAR